MSDRPPRAGRRPSSPASASASPCSRSRSACACCTSCADRFWQPDPTLGTRLIPGARGWWTQEEHEFIVPVQINTQGRRDLERPLQKPPGTQRILLLGDSFVEAMQVPIEQTFARQLEAALNRSGAPPLEVISMGVSGYGTASQYLWYRDDGRAYQPDLVLLSFYPGNDVRNNSPTLEPTLRPAVRRRRQPAAGARRQGPRPGRARHGWARRRPIGTSARCCSRASPRSPNAWPTSGLLDRAALRPVPMADGVPVDYWVYAADPPPPWRDAWAHTERLLGALRDARRRRTARAWWSWSSRRASRSIRPTGSSSCRPTRPCRRWPGISTAPNDACSTGVRAPG